MREILLILLGLTLTATAYAKPPISIMGAGSERVLIVNGAVKMSTAVTPSSTAWYGAPPKKVCNKDKCVGVTADKKLKIDTK